MSARAFLGAGDLYLQRFDVATQTFLALEGPFEAKKFEIKPNSEVKEQVSRGKTTYGAVIESVPIPKPSDLSISMTEVTKQSMELALFGQSSSTSQAAGTLTNEPVTAKLDKWVALTKENLVEASVVVTNEAGAVTYVKGTDYVVNAALGMVKALSTGAIADNAVLHVDAGYSAFSATKISGGTQSQVRAKFLFDGVNFADQSPCIVRVHEGIMTPDSAFDFLQDNFGEIGLKGRMKTPAGFSEPFTVELRATA